MITQLIFSTSTSLTKESLLDYIQEVFNKKSIIYALIKEKAVAEYNKSEESSSIPLLCEVYYCLLKISDFINQKLIDIGEKPKIRLKPDDILIYLTFYDSIKMYERELKHLFSIALVSREDNV